MLWWNMEEVGKRWREGSLSDTYRLLAYFLLCYSTFIPETFEYFVNDGVPLPVSDMEFLSSLLFYGIMMVCASRAWMRVRRADTTLNPLETLFVLGVPAFFRMLAFVTVVAFLAGLGVHGYAEIIGATDAEVAFMSDLVVSMLLVALSLKYWHSIHRGLDVALLGGEPENSTPEEAAS